MPITLDVTDISKLEELLGKRRYYSELLDASPLLTVEALTIFTEQMEIVSTDSAPVEDEENDDEDDVEFDDGEDGQVALGEIDDTERKQLDGALRGILIRRIAKLDIELKKFGVTVA